MSEIEMKIKEKTKSLEELCEKLEKKLCAHLEGGIDDADVDEVGKVVDMIKDLCDAKEKCVKSMYHEQIMEAMDESENEYGRDWDENGPLRGYRGRSARTGRFVHRPYTESRDLDRKEGRMYYSEEPMDGRMMENRRMYGESAGNGMSTMGSRSYSDGSVAYENGYQKGYTDGKMSNQTRYDIARRGYEEADHTQKREKLQQLMDALEQDLTPYMPTMDANDKQIVKNGLQKMINRFN